MTLRQLILIPTAALILYGCDNDDQKDKNYVKESAKPQAQETSTIDKATETIKEKAKEIIKLDTSSLDSFKSSLGEMKDSLSVENKGKLTSALGSLAQKAVSQKQSQGGLMDMAKSTMKSGDIEGQIYESFGDKLNGMSFDDLLAYAK